MAKRRVPNVVRGGAAIPLKGKTNYYYMTGRKHIDGGIDIGQNPKTGIEVEDGEVMHITDDEVKVFSAVPFLNGESPAQKVIRGENANKVFNEQEQFKKTNNIKDDGSRKKQMGGDDKKVNVSKPNELSRDAIKNLSEDSFMDLYIDNSGNIHYGHMFEPDENYITKYGLTYIPIDDRNSFFKSYLKSLDYIGGTTEQSRDRFFDKMPNVSQFIDSIAPKYNITSELLRHRLSKEGFVDKAIKEYNNRSNKYKQQNFNNTILNDTTYNGFHQFGLDNGYEYLTKRKTGLKDDVEWYDVEAENEKGKTVKAATGKTVRDNIILQAAVLEHLKNEMKAKGVPEEKLETWTNAAFNLGPYHKDLNDSTFIEKNYNFKKKRMGGDVDEDEIFKIEQNKRIKSALEKSRTRTLPKVPYIEKNDRTRDYDRDELQLAKERLDNYINKEKQYNILSKASEHLPNSIKRDFDNTLRQRFSIQMDDADYAKEHNGVKPFKNSLIDSYEECVKTVEEELMPGSSCIYTVLDNYDIDNPTPSNITFESNPKKYGFIKIPNDSLKSGDLVQYLDNGIPIHAMIFDSYDENGKKLFNYSNGGSDEYAIKIKKRYSVGEDFNTYRFVGQSKDSINWKNKKRMGGKHNTNNKELGFGNRGFYSVTDKGKTRYYMIPSTGNSSARSAEGRSKAELGTKLKNWWKDNKGDVISDGIGLVSNIAGSLISHSMNKNMLNRLKPAPQPIARQATKLKTQININPQLDKMRETVAAYERNIDNNTSSSNVALARKQNARLANILNTNELYGTKENIETELINKDRLNQQAISEKNVTDYNKWSTDVANFGNTILEQKANNDVSLVNNLNAGIQNMLTVRDKRNAENQTIAAMALANPNLPIEMFFEQGLISRKLYNAYKKAYPKKNVEP